MTSILGELQVGDSGQVTAFRNAGAAYRRKLLAMGLTPGVQFTVCRIAPLGDPIQLQVRGFQLSVRRDEAAVVEVSQI
ncbi:ferrous iron transport protein A [Endozoicomonas gorgoniicola]|uniref:Ferrous iron transport protein A n=1 Tax=Endozoicomonas gorgoniicola TaxID=1234144 RepID=A0ABT3MSL9_9GAMM|nr:FeoA family protein [Endozoicomonas gorgoniicola]MCW7552362.1 ferrous iron transport protein A [Endozoicomonas gorgoniicola]